MKRVWIGIALVASAAIGCSLANLPSQVLGDSGTGGQAGAAEEGQVLFEDDFSDPGSGWDIVEGVTDYHEGSYRIFAAEPTHDYWANPGRHFGGDVRIDVDATKAGGPEDNNFGVLCRYSQEDGFNYYSFQISSDGYAWITRVDNGEAVGISSEQMQSVDFIVPGEATNHLTVYCTGDQLSLWVNGENVASATDSTYSDGDIGLLAGTYETVGTDIRFDNLTVQAD